MGPLHVLRANLEERVTLEDSMESELHTAIKQGEAELARCRGALLAVAEALEGERPPQCFDPEPELLALQVRQLKEQVAELGTGVVNASADLERERRMGQRLRAHLRSIGDIVGARPDHTGDWIVRAVEVMEQDLAERTRQLKNGQDELAEVRAELTEVRADLEREAAR